MGAINIELDLKGALNKEEIEKTFLAVQQAEAIENGHQQGYSGDFQTVRTVDIRTAQVFNSYGDAETYCLKHAVKWETVVAVRYREGEKINTLIAGWGAC